MTARQLFEYALIELNKVQAPSLILEDYNYFINKAVNQYINKMYNLYDANQQKTDDLRVLKSSAVLTPTTLPNSYGTSALLSKVYEIDLPDDYLHILNCVVEYKVNKTFKCYNAGDTVHFGAKRLTADMFSQIINNYYMRPQYKNPYFYINNVTTDTLLPTNDTRSAVEADGIKYILSNISNADGTEAIIISIDGVTKTYVIPTLASTLVASILVDYPDLKMEIVSNSIIFYVYISNNYTNSIEIVNGNYTDLSGTSVAISIGANRVAKVNYGNASKVRLEIRYGKDNTLFELNQVYVDYLKSPQFIRLTQEQVDEVEDNSQMLEFPDYVCQEITNELIKLLMENASDPRLQTNIPINQSIASPAQEQQKR